MFAQLKHKKKIFTPMWSLSDLSLVTSISAQINFANQAIFDRENEMDRFTTQQMPTKAQTISAKFKQASQKYL